MMRGLAETALGATSLTTGLVWARLVFLALILGFGVDFISRLLAVCLKRLDFGKHFLMRGCGILWN